MDFLQFLQSLEYKYILSLLVVLVILSDFLLGKKVSRIEKKHKEEIEALNKRILKLENRKWLF